MHEKLQSARETTNTSVPPRSALPWSYSRLKFTSREAESKKSSAPALSTHSSLLTSGEPDDYPGGRNHQIFCSASTSTISAFPSSAGEITCSAGLPAAPPNKHILTTATLNRMYPVLLPVDFTLPIPFWLGYPGLEARR
ncbi:hypothetical protein MIND_01376200 [Mycena indigotica]|uniref:Uncharacterized protein n=1 Tax=Mycena indigotica TaxID=2126181 RepID=A0A8H6RZK4_9AGAR|nr:uncharacterized protein MIND_01376200 [Mycena indigotica]KAF7289152.1 hypothetical protein MIND_01376200 [Mycena indigotica]